ncbi:opioid growth factor receptor region [Venturia nashicola]|uniref:Opioid growth factor receptor region n=1 Tax=Venturia nashicola TaxID=86259 RepID=A0A4Z1P2U8_9PEZI|nr:opioid growth factor receptor region [Venturia nashicola]
MASSKREAPGKDALKSPKRSKTTSVIVKFYDPIEKAPDGFGRTLSSMLQWPDSQLESAHNYIQVWFPLPEGSPFNWNAPVIDSETCSEFRSRPELRKSLQKAFTRILKFYGFEASFEGEEVHIHRSMEHTKQFRNWVTSSNHNHLRISRIIRSLRVLGLEQNAQAFYQALQAVNNDYPNTIGAQSLMYWRRAAVRRLALEPAENNETVKGQSFLSELDEAIGREKEVAKSTEKTT